ELALFYGSTWFVISIVIGAILIMAFLANLMVTKIGAPDAKVTYGLLFISLIAGYFVSSVSLNFLPLWLDQLVRVTVLTIPIFFSGIAFSTQLQSYASVDKALSANLLGAMFGGFLEYNAMYFGFQSLYILALVMYLLAFLGTVRLRSGQFRPVWRGVE
ncbi:MAG: hypothetical protein R3264_20955, partial [Anaerolineae bacterium]|nr:hypothetical protein [Anaerolineae bacterium]